MGKRTKLWQRWLSLVLAIYMTLSNVPLGALAQETEENLWEGRSAVFVGDSITAGVGTDKIYYQYLEGTLGFGSVTAMGVGGSCISAASDYGQNNQPLINRYQNIPSADLIMIFMGTNDYGHETPLGTLEDTQDSTFYGALNTIVSYLVAKHTSGKLVFVTPLHRYGFGTSKILGTKFTYDHIPNGVGATLGDYVNAVKTVCAKNGVSVVDLYTECTLDPTDAAVREQYMPDGLHPNAAGHEVVAGILETHIRSFEPVGKEPVELPEMVQGNKFAAGNNQPCRASSRVNYYLKAGTVITLKDPAAMQWACAKTSDENSSNNLGYFPEKQWTDIETAVVAEDGWVGFTFKYRDETQAFDLTKPLTDYITIAEPFSGKTVSILSHSMSTYAGVSNNTSYNSTIGSNDVYYTEGRHGVYREDTWWQQAIDALGMELLVNNSWSGSCIFQPRKGEASVGYGDRAVNLHNDHTGEEPDIIWVYLGGNDFAYYQDTFGKAADVDYAVLIRENTDGTFTYAAPTTACEAYAIMLHKVHNRYPDADIYCMTSTARRDPDYTGDSYPDAGQPTAFMAELHKVADKYGFPVVDLETVIPKEAAEFDKYIADKRAHCNALGMDKITNKLLTVMLGKESEIRHVTSGNGTVAEQAVLLGGSYGARVTVPEGHTLSVTMDGEDITEEAFSNGSIYIANVTGDIAVALKRGPESFRWEMQNNALVSTGETENALTLLSGTVTDGVLEDARFSLTTPVELYHDRPWVVEWKYTEDWRGVVLSSEPAKLAPGRCYLTRTKGGQLCFGSWDGTQYHNYGVDLSALDAGTHTYRLENRIADDGSNMVYLYLDGAEIGPMNHYFIGSKDQNSTDDWLSGKDFVLPYIGSDSTLLDNCAFQFLAVWEDGHSHDYKEVVTAPTCTEAGYVTNVCTVCGDSQPTTQTTDITDRFQWKEGYVISATGGGMSADKNWVASDYVDISAFETIEIVTGDTVNANTTLGIAFYNANKQYISGVVHTDKTGTEYGILVHNLTVPENAVYLRSTWYSVNHGSYAGATLHTFYCKGSGSGIPPLGHSYALTDSTVPTCTSQGAEVYTCTACGDSYTETLKRLEHSYDNGVCTVCSTSILGGDWLAPNFAQGDYTMVVVPDTQILVQYWPEIYQNQMQWIADNKQTLNIQAVLHMGDMVNNNNDTEWTLCEAGTDKLEAAGIPWMPMRGNHDDSAWFNKYYDYATYGTNKSWFGGSYHADKLDHTYWFVTVGQKEYLILSLGWAPSWEVLDWAKAVVDDHSDKSVILVDHAYMNSDGTLLSQGDAHCVSSYHAGYPNGDDVWNAFKDYGNVVLAMGGHIHSADVVTYVDKNGAGRDVTSLLFDRQNDDISNRYAMVALLTFHEDSETVDINWYSTRYDALYRQKNQFSIEVPDVCRHSYLSETVEATCTESGGTRYTCDLCGHVYWGNQIAALGHSFKNNRCANCGLLRIDMTGQFTDWTEGGPVLYRNGYGYGEEGYPDGANPNLKYSDYISVEGMDTLELTICARKGNTPTGGYAFYTDKGVEYFISEGASSRNGNGAAAEGTVVHTIEIPEDAKYIRVSYWVESTDYYAAVPFSCVGYKMSCSHSYENGSCLGCGEKAPWAAVSSVDLFVFAGQSNMMGAAVLEPEVDTFTDNAWEYKYMPKLRGQETGSFVPAQNSAGEWHYQDLDAAYGEHWNDLTYQSTLSNYSANTYFCPAMSNGTKGFSAQSEADMYPSASLPPYFAAEYASYGHSSIYAHMAKGAVKITHYFTEEMINAYNTLISAYNAENGTSYASLSSANLSGAGDAFDAKYTAMVEDYVTATSDGSITNKCFVWLQGESEGGSSIEYKLKMQVLWEHLQELGFTYFFVLRVGFWGSTGVRNVIKAQEEFCAENENCYIVTRAPSLIPHPDATTDNWWISEPSGEYADCRDSYVVEGSGNHHFNEKAMELFAERSAENIHRILYQGLEPILEEENIQGMTTEDDGDQPEEDGTPYTSYIGTQAFCNQITVSKPQGEWVQSSSASARSTDLIPVKSTDSVWLQYVFIKSEAHAVGGFYDADGNLVAPLYYQQFGFSLDGNTGGVTAFRTPESTNRISIAEVEAATGKKIAFVRFTAWQASEGGHANSEARIYHGAESKNLEGKVISILSASTSTFAGWIPEADGFNLAHRARYPQDNLFTEVEHTWWHQLITQLDAKLGINDSWAGSQVLNTQDTNSGDLGPDAAMASLTRIQNLGANGTPDIILFFGAGNDMGRSVPLGSFDPATAPTEADLTAYKWDNLAEAYTAAILRLKHFYPDARIVVMTTYAMPSYVTEAKLDKYGPVIQAICDHYGIERVSLRDCGITFDMLPDNIHPNAEGMDHITQAVLDYLLEQDPMEPGENVVYSVKHELTNAQASRHYYKGVSAGRPFEETLSGEDLTVTVTMGGVDITDAVYADGKLRIENVTGDIVITAKGAFNADGHLQQLPENVCCGTNLWTALEPENIYYTVDGWGNTTAGTTWSITFPVKEGDRIWGTSLGAYPENGSSANGVRVTWFDENGVLATLDRNTVYKEFAANGYITAPEGAVALNVPMTGNQDHYAVYLLSAEHAYESVVTKPTCTESGYTTHTCTICGDSYVDGETEETGHSYEYAVTREPSAHEEGVLTGTCEACGGETTVVLPKLDDVAYDYAVTKEPTRTETGTAIYTWKNTDYGTITITVELERLDILLGDVDGNGTVNTRDRIILTRYLANWEGYDEEDVDLLAADVNQDGIVNTKDRIILTRHLANWIGYEELPYKK